MNSLKELREWFLADPENRVTAFKVADHYLIKYDENPQGFRPIPREDAFVRPVVEAFAGDSAGYAEWLRKLARTYLVRGSYVSQFVGNVAKVAQCRGINRRKRLIEIEAVRQAVIQGRIRDTPLEKARYKRRVSEWVKRDYKAVLDGERRKTHNGRLSLEERDELVKQYWDDLLQQFTSGEIPEA
jgi:hypothetical protein